MFARILMFPLPADKLVEAGQMLNETTIGVVLTLPGFRNLLALGDHRSGKLITIALYDTTAELDAAWTNPALQEQVQRIAGWSGGVPTPNTFDVNVRAIPALTGESSAAGRPACARVVTARLRPGRADELVHLFQQSVLLAAREQRGYQGHLLLTDRPSGRGVSVSLWESEAALAASATSGYLQEQLGKVTNLLVEPPTQEVFAVLAIA
jgi:heme-degrading monooxygenase HmoA